MSNDFVEFGESNLIPIENGWFLNKKTKEKIDPDGRVFNEKDELVFDPNEFDKELLENKWYLDQEYEWWHDREKE